MNVHSRIFEKGRHQKPVKGLVKVLVLQSSLDITNSLGGKMSYSLYQNSFNQFIMFLVFLITILKRAVVMRKTKKK